MADYQAQKRITQFYVIVHCSQTELPIHTHRRNKNYFINRHRGGNGKQTIIKWNMTAKSTALETGNKSQ